MSVIHVAVATDREYALPLAAMLASLTERLDPARPLVIHVLADRLTEEVWSRLVRSIHAGRVEWNRIDVNTDDLVHRGFATRPWGHISEVTYCRLLLPELLPKAVEKVLYLDCDLIVCDDIAPLWDIDIADVALAAAPEQDLAGRRVLAPRLLLDDPAPRMASDRPLFNVGVLLINLVRWREERIAERAFACLRAVGPDIRWYDQDALNLVIDGNFRQLELRWNARPLHRKKPLAEVPPIAIMHYFTAKKPWHWDYRWSHREHFFGSLDRTAWAGWRPERPRFARTRLLLEGALRAVRKNRERILRRGMRLGRRLRYHLVPFTSPGGAPPRELGRPREGEIRLFLVLPPNLSLGELRSLLRSYRDGSVDRAFVLECSPRKSSGISEGFGFPVHRFRCRSEDAATALRRLLDRYGVGSWCVVVTSAGVLTGEDESSINFREWCLWLESEGVDACEARTGVTATAPIDLIGRDTRSGRLFRGTALVERPARAWDLPAFGSRLVVLKYRKSMLLDAALILIGNANRSDHLLRFTPWRAGAEPSNGQPIESREQQL